QQAGSGRLGFCQFSSFKPVTESAHADQKLRLGRNLLDLLSQIEYVGIYRAIRDRHAVAPSGLDDLIAAEHAAAIAHKHAEEAQFRGSDLDGAAAPPQFGAAEVHFTIAELRNSRFVNRGPPQLSANAGPQLAQAERFSDVIVGAGVEPHNFL